MICEELIVSPVECKLAPFKPQGSRTPCQQVEVAENGSSGIFVVEEFVEEKVDAGPKWIQCKVAYVLSERECCKCQRKGQMSEGRLVNIRKK
jgi:hypothetical protein